MGNLYAIIFSNDTKYRLARHFMFWFLWIFFYAFVQTYRLHEYQSVSFTNQFPISVGEMLIQIPIDLLFCYGIIYFLLPVFFIKGKYLLFIAGWLVLLLLCASLQHVYFYETISWYRLQLGLKPPMTDSSFFLGVILIIGSLNTEGGFALAIKLGKMFFIKEREAELLSQEKEQISAHAELHDETQSTFLSTVLNRIYVLSNHQKIDVAVSLQKINSLVLYSCYRSKQALLPLERELEAFKEYVELQKISYNNRVEIKYVLKGSSTNKQIAYYILIPLVENSFNNVVENGSGSFLHVDINVMNQSLIVKISSSKAYDSSTLLGDKNNNLYNIEKRLKLLYPGSYRLSKIIEPGVLTVELSIHLHKKLSA